MHTKSPEDHLSWTDSRRSQHEKPRRSLGSLERARETETEVENSLRRGGNEGGGIRERKGLYVFEEEEEEEEEGEEEEEEGGEGNRALLGKVGSLSLQAAVVYLCTMRRPRRSRSLDPPRAATASATARKTRGACAQGGGCEVMFHELRCFYSQDYRVQMLRRALRRAMEQRDLGLAHSSASNDSPRCGILVGF